MGTALAIRGDYAADDLRRLARQSRDADWSRRLIELRTFNRTHSLRPWFRHSWLLKRLQMDPSAFESASNVRAAAALRCALILAKAISIGFKSGE